MTNKPINWLGHLPSPYANYTSFTEIKLGRHPCAFLGFGDVEKFIKQVPEHIQQKEYAVLSWLESIRSGHCGHSNILPPSQLQIPKPELVSFRKDLLITSKLGGLPITKTDLLEAAPTLCRSLAYLHQLVEVAQLPSVVVQSLDYELPIAISDVPSDYHPQFLQAKTHIEQHVSILGFLHGDLSDGNILFNSSTNEIGIVDWEYANVRDCRWDLATIAVEFELENTSFEKVCDLYLLSRNVQDTHFFEVAKSWAVIYALTCLCWAKDNQINTNRYVQFLQQIKS